MAKLQKKDLAKEFSDIVQQEIKNHNDLLLASNMAIDDMRRKLDEVKVQSEKRIAALKTDLAMQTSSLDVVKEFVMGELSKFQRKIDDSLIGNKDDLNKVRKAMIDREEYFLTINGFEQFKLKIDEWMANIKRAFSVQKDTLCQDAKKIGQEAQCAIDSIEKSLKASIEKEADARREQDKQLDLFALNFDGVKREIEIVKKRCFIIEKNIENIYTQIEKLKVNK